MLTLTKERVGGTRWGLTLFVCVQDQQIRLPMDLCLRQFREPADVEIGEHWVVAVHTQGIVLDDAWRYRAVRGKENEMS